MFIFGSSHHSLAAVVTAAKYEQDSADWKDTSAEAEMRCVVPEAGIKGRDK